MRGSLVPHMHHTKGLLTWDQSIVTVQEFRYFEIMEVAILLQALNSVQDSVWCVRLSPSDRAATHVGTEQWHPVSLAHSCPL